jgi:dCMP deaminase
MNKMNKMNKKWMFRFMRMAKESASWSKDQSSKVGCVIVDNEKTIRTTGYNGIPRNVNDYITERHVRPTKYLWYNHAEANAIANCARTGMPTNGCTIFVTHPPCSACTRAIIQSGIKKVVVDSGSMTVDFLSRWQSEYDVAKVMMNEAGVTLTILKKGKGKGK